MLDCSKILVSSSRRSLCLEHRRSDLFERSPFHLLREEVEDPADEEQSGEEDESREHRAKRDLLLDSAAADHDPHDERTKDLRARANAVAQAEARAARLLGELLTAEGVEDAEGAIAECHCDEDAAEEDHPRAGLPVLAEKATMSAPMAPITVPSPEQARMMPVWVPERFQGLVSKETTKPMRNMSKNSEMFKTMTRAMRLLWCQLSGRESICSRALGPCS